MAIFCKDLKLVYIASPRTGCTSVEKCLKKHFGGAQIGLKHSTLNETLSEIPPENYFHVTNIRNPFDSLVSFYLKQRHRFCPQIRSGHPPLWMTETQIQRCLRLSDENNFEKHLLTLGKFRGFGKDRRFNYYIAFEHLQEDFDRMLLKLGVFNTQKLPHLNQTKNKRDYKEYYTSAAKATAIAITEEYRSWTHYTFSGRLTIL